MSVVSNCSNDNQGRVQRFVTLDDVFSIGSKEFVVSKSLPKSAFRNQMPGKFIQRGSFASHNEISTLSSGELLSKMKSIAGYK